ISFSNIEKFSVVNLVVRLTNDVTQIQNVLMLVLQPLMRMPILFIGGFILAVRSIPQLWWIIILMVILVGGISYFVVKNLGKRFGKIQWLMDKVNAKAKENLQGMRGVKSFNQEANEEQRFTNVSDEVRDVKLRIESCFYMISRARMVFGGV